ncbi:hypothetical protein pneo_cds_601 [Pandoravirus neocaledonia]|uniref:Uncharacterized protein n=1 Tax=Pandoravirus neocaledonia TaxID=2107708 RepID=A0A2U7UCL6_9VIRU|nr:hypothetical protein pneo_cds_601 [Pandoravirus neocaledonia]AVK76208.1 hypothetical protein pneo_cds_601 [Pandoravirus neocaledonia]
MSFDRAAPILAAALGARLQHRSDNALEVAPVVPNSAATRGTPQADEPEAAALAVQQEQWAHHADESTPDSGAEATAQDTSCALASVMTDAILSDHDIRQEEDSARWRACRCNHMATAHHEPASQRGSGTLWPYVAVVLVIAGTLALTVWLDDPVRIIGPETLAVGFGGANTTVNASLPSVSLAVADDNGTDQNNGNNDGMRDDDAWCACLCQPKGPLLTGRIVDDQCACQCAAQQPPSASVYPSYAVCAATIAQLASLLVAATMLGCILAP